MWLSGEKEFKIEGTVQRPEEGMCSRDQPLLWAEQSKQETYEYFK